MSISVDGRAYDVFDLNHNYDEAVAFCDSRGEKLLPIDISDIVGTRIHLTKISQKIEENNNDYDDIDIWFPYQLNDNTRIGFRKNLILPKFDLQNP